ncbi:hypothetical protein J0H58_38475 [bacterium]|nr:hypothetical protein [bacterium]
MKPLSSVAGLALAVTAVLFVCGDFTPYVGDPAQDVWVSPPDPEQQLLLAATVGVPFALFTALLFSATGWLFPGAQPLRLGLGLAPGLCAVVYYFGPFKELFAGPPPNRVHYELPRGPERLLVSAVCSAGMATLSAVGCLVWQASSPEEGAEGPNPALQQTAGASAVRDRSSPGPRGC